MSDFLALLLLVSRKPDGGDNAADLDGTCIERECGIAAASVFSLKYSSMSLLSVGTPGGPLCPEQIIYYNAMAAEGRPYVPETRKQLQGRQTKCCCQFFTKALIRVCYRATNYLK